MSILCTLLGFVVIAAVLVGSYWYAHLVFRIWGDPIKPVYNYGWKDKAGITIIGSIFLLGTVLLSGS